MKHIRIISPSGVMDPNWIQQAEHRLEKWGFRVSRGQHVSAIYGRFAGTIEQRLIDLNEAFADESVDIIICARGGYGLQQIVDKIVLPTRQKEKWPLVVGFSDITVLHALMNSHGVPSLHASMCKALATLPEYDPVLLQMREALEKGKNIDALKGTALQGRKVIGGNLSVLYGLQGTPYSLNAIIDRCEDAPVLLIEDVGERHYHIDRMLHNLRMSGIFDKISGLVVGQFTDCADDVSMGCTLLESIRQIAEPYTFPILFDYPSGHIDSNYPLLFSQKYHLSVTNF